MKLRWHERSVGFPVTVRLLNYIKSLEKGADEYYKKRVEELEKEVESLKEINKKNRDLLMRKD